MSIGTHPLSPSDPDPDLDYIVVVRSPADGSMPVSDSIDDAVRRHAGSTLERLAIGDDMTLWRRRDRVDITLSSDRSAIVLGTAFETQGAQLSGAALDRILAGTDGMVGRMGRAITTLCWGRYLALLRPAAHRTAAFAFRDPLGTMPGWHATANGVAVIAPSWPRWLAAAAGVDDAIDEAMVAHMLAHPLVPVHRSLLHGLPLLQPGRLHALFSRARGDLLWSAQEIAGDGYPRDPSHIQNALRATIDRVCASWIGRHRSIVMQLWGGLDSAIVLASVARSCPPESLAAINLATTYREGDERQLARDAARLHHVALTERVAVPEAMDFSALDRSAGMMTPRLYGLDMHQEDMVAALARERDATAIMTGQGGDAVFFQMAYPDVAVDHRRDHGWRSYKSAMPWIAARRSYCSVWRVWAMMARDQLGLLSASPASADYDRRLLGKRAIDMLDPRIFQHPWLEDAEGLPPAKRLHLEAISNSLLFFSPTLRHQVAPVIHPLLSQPVIELCLSIPVHQLACDLRDRPLARDAFRDRLPPTIFHRTGKGETSRYSNRAVVANLPFLRDYLLGGELVGRGLVDGAKLDAVLDEDHLITGTQARTPLFYTAVEAWLRRWSR